MGLVIRRARAATGLPIAATGAALIATLLLTGLALYSRDVVAAGGRSAVSAARPDERSLLVRGSAGGDAARLQARDAALRARFAGGLGGRRVRISGAGYALARQLTNHPGAASPGTTGPGTADPDAGGIAFASTVYLDDLADHADLVSGGWARPGAARTEVTLGEAAAGILGATVGGRLSITDRRTERATEVVVRGIWRPRDADDPYWQLAPEAAEGVVPGTSTYGPIVLHREDFLRGYASGASVGWVVEPDLVGAGLAELTPLRRELTGLVDALPQQVGLDDSGQVTTRLDNLVDRLGRADLVGRSALVTPMLLIAVTGGYALMLVALLLGEHRRAETALIRARGAGRRQIAGLAAREAGLVVLPAAILAPVLVPWLLGQADRAPLLAAADLRLDGTDTRLGWAVAAAAAAGCLVAMVLPAVRHSGTYLEELTSRSRPSRWAVAQRAGVDLAIVAFAVLAWFQLRQYSSPLAGVGGA
ncbi:MAG TPA: FtsX-like permease family protein, partial [Pilimelia sp.]|nr:FtsX-like permease family protein [Pilimelia sp.]